MSSPAPQTDEIWKRWGELLTALLDERIDCSRFQDEVLRAYPSPMFFTDAAALPFALWPLERYAFALRGELCEDEPELKSYAAEFRAEIESQFIRRDSVFEKTILFGIEHLNAPLLSASYRRQSSLYEAVAVIHDLLSSDEGVSHERIERALDPLDSIQPDCLSGLLHRNLLTAAFTEEARTGMAVNAGRTAIVARLHEAGPHYLLDSEQKVLVRNRLNRLTGHTEIAVTLYAGSADPPVVTVVETGFSIAGGPAALSRPAM